MHADRCPTLQSSRPRARIRSPAAAHCGVRRTDRGADPWGASGCRRCHVSGDRYGETGTLPKQPYGDLGHRMRNCLRVQPQVAMRLATIAAFVLFSAPLAVEAQQPGKVYRVGVLTNKTSDPAEARLWQAFRSGLRERGWIEGKNILIEFRAAEGNTARLPEL